MRQGGDGARRDAPPAKGSSFTSRRAQHIRDVVTFEADTVEGLRREFRTSVEDYLEFCAELGQEPDRPFSGRFVLRLDPELHRDATSAAESQGISLNAWVTGAVQERLGATSGKKRQRPAAVFQR